MTTGPVAYVTDVEGQWERFEGFLARTSGVRLRDERLELEDGWTFVFGGDAIDRGPASRRIVRRLVEAKERYADRVILIAGNRDLNKMRLVRELDGHPPARAPSEIRRDRPALLRFILASTMGAADAFAHRATELAHEGLPSDDASVVDSFLADLEPAGDLTRFLAATQLAYRHGPTLFLHGGLTEESLFEVPGRSRIDGVEHWIEALNDFCREQVERFRTRTPRDLAEPPWAPLVAYQAPTPGRPTNPSSVVYGRISDELNNPQLPARPVIDALAREGLRRVVLGHTPTGDTPAVLRADRFELVVADNSRGRVASGSAVILDGDAMDAGGASTLDSGETVEVAHRFVLGKSAGPLGMRTRDTGSLVKGRTPDGRCVLFRCLPGHVIEQIAVTDDELAARGLESAWPR